MSRTSRYLRILKSVFRVLKRLRVRRFKSRFSNRLFSVWQHVALLVLLAYENKSYRRFVDWLSVCSELVAFLRLKRIPHFTTLQKALSRIGRAFLEGFLRMFSGRRAAIAAPDSTGFRPTRASFHYFKKITRNGMERRKRRRFVKPTIFADMHSQLVLSVKVRRGPANDSPDFKPVLQKAKTKIALVVADKGYDSEENHQQAHAMGADCIIPPRNQHVPVCRTKGRWRKKMKRGYSLRRYHQRSKVETIFSVVKRLSGDSLRSTSVRMQNREQTLKFIAYNAHRKSRLFYFNPKDFY